MPDKLSRELHLLERFLPTLLGNQPYTVSQPAPPLPDAILHVGLQAGDRKIGIEMTALILDESSRERESKQDAVLNEAQKLFEQQLPLPLHVTVAFSTTADWRNLERKQAAKALADTVKRCVVEVKDLPESQTQFNIRTETVIHPCIQSVGVLFMDRLTIPCWTPITSFWVPDAPADKIQAIIDRKNQNISGYLRGCDEVWLLILEAGSPSSYYDGFEKLDETIFTSGFARTLIGRVPTGELVALPTQLLHA